MTGALIALVIALLLVGIPVFILDMAERIYKIYKNK